MQLNGYSLNVINITIKDSLQIYSPEHKSKELEPLKMFISYGKDAAEKLKMVARKYAFTIVFTKTKDLGGHIRANKKIIIVIIV